MDTKKYLQIRRDAETAKRAEREALAIAESDARKQSKKTAPVCRICGFPDVECLGHYGVHPHFLTFPVNPTP